MIKVKDFNPAEAAPAVNEALRILNDAGVLEFIREQGRPALVGQGADVNVMAAQASQTIGFNACMDCLLYFKELFVDNQFRRSPTRDFGGRREALGKRYIESSELEKVSA